MAVLIGAPAAWFAASRWLETFPSRIQLGLEPVVAAGVLALGIALVSVAGQALRAAMSDPVHTLRTE